MKPSLPWLRTGLALTLLAWGTCQAQILIGQTVGVTGSAAATAGLAGAAIAAVTLGGAAHTIDLGPVFVLKSR